MPTPETQVTTHTQGTTKAHTYTRIENKQRSVEPTGRRRRRVMVDFELDFGFDFGFGFETGLVLIMVLTLVLVLKRV